MDGRTRRFLDISTQLTGFARVDLAGTGMTEDYLRALDEVLPSTILDQLLSEWPAEGDGPRGTMVLDDPMLGPVARNIILLWYRGTWSRLPEAWRQAHGASPRDEDRLVSGAAYRAGLQWTAAGAHPPGASPQGYAAWSAPPASTGS